MSTAILILESTDSGIKDRILGCIRVTKDNKKRNLPLTSVHISARVADRLAHVTVKETFKNPYTDHLEAVYIFPLSGGCAVSSFEMKVGDRTIVGKVDERQAAREQYAEALQEGKRAALMEQERDDVFTVQVGNLPPGEEVTVTMTYSEKLAYFDNGTTEIRLPLVVAPRYIPGQALNRDNVGDGVELDTDIVPDASRITPPRLAQGVDPKTALNLTVELAGDQTIEDLSCSQHATRVGTSKDGVKVSLSREDDLLDRDFVLRWRVATDALQSNFLVYRHPENKDECYGMISLLPPQSTDIASPPRDVIFVVDRSGSMQGVKMVSAARACSLLLATLGPKDRFAVQAFDNVCEWMNQDSDRFVLADETGIEAGNKFLRGISSRGGTEMHRSLQEAILTMKTRKNPSRRLPVIVVLTDGEVGNEGAILKHIQSELADSRVFTIGVDTAVNDGFLRRLASIGGGTATFVQPGAQLEDALSGVGREIGTPLVTGLTIEDVNCGLDNKSVAPSKLSDLFEGRASSAFFRFSAGKLKDLKNAKVKVKGQFVDGKPFVEEVVARIIDVPALAQLWAKAYVVDLEDKYRIASAHEQAALHKEIVEVAVAHSLLTKFTAFVVVDHAEIVNAGGANRKIVQPVQMPAKWEMAQSNAPASPAPAFFQNSPARYGSASAPASAGWGGAASGSMKKAKSSERDKCWTAPSSSWDAPTSQQAPMSQQPQQAPQAPRSMGAPMPSAGPVSAFSLDDQAATGANFIENEPMGSMEADGCLPPPVQEQPLTLAESIRRKIQSSQGKNKDQKEAAPTGLSQSYRNFEMVLKKIFAAINNGTNPGSEELDEARMQLIAVLSNSELAVKLPLLQKYLRADVIQLIASIESSTTVSVSLKTLAIEHEKLFLKVAEESAAIGAAHRPFWQLNV